MIFENLILGNNAIFTTDSKCTGLNNNVCVIGGSGSGKTYSIVKPNLLETKNSSLIISDPKGALEKEFKKYFIKKGHKVYSVDLINPDMSTHTINPMINICSEQDIIKLAHKIIYSEPSLMKMQNMDPYWDKMSELLLSALIARICMVWSGNECTLTKIMEDLTLLSVDGIDVLDSSFENIERYKPNCLAVMQWKKVRAVMIAEKTWTCIISSLFSHMGRYASEEMCSFFKNENQVDFEKFGEEKSVLFLKISDTDDTYYTLANIIYAQALDCLCRHADSRDDGKCKVPIRFILDDFATNVIIEGMPRIISTIRARNISLMLILQSMYQLEVAYGYGAKTIISNCDSLVFCGGCNCLETARDLSIRLDKPVTEILYQKRGVINVFRSGMQPIETTRYDYMKHENYPQLRKYSGLSKFI